ncbi:class I SAM-dependent methyltransferase [Phaeobacter gallaeciensis]|uniref:S-adenosyl-L-methionine methyltransferase n=1 Tax=Phaeobacter gallaeciensis TaxID=60890 RepID=A0AAC9ZBC5_9RHOB|nr:class I SAM-dependent methyltransferase [Phaeobacter gallaeciensis]AHD10797.1 S-adenosyl-L-methionine methyltransferase [Phaeobacter gallaeciensis DSM 26640]ATE94060.1 S-adenosyl-L-methionine methyltransferase [Phaeobacter gallaeciensis]ATE96119.1 S-adenosyl-L-methionine methyltransferase [Phaeobacter gallaeciensis]ATF02724.1 S-adenosyl-L-methionine methyltransferase [Phaeobacter gallaeciensis]ATF07104.1 S-adenosyl-L-methionine methyltransferase [Phaeobacter gallaeciensis]
MSRLDSMLRRLTAQRDGLNWAAEQVRNLPGDVLDIGLGNGRTYDHLRETLPDRRVRVIDRVLQCHPSCVPPEADFLQGEARPMLGTLAQESRRIILAHYDLGFGVKEKDVAEAAALSPAIAAVMAQGGIIVSGQPLVGFDELDGPQGIPPGRYLFYRVR